MFLGITCNLRKQGQGTIIAAELMFPFSKADILALFSEWVTPRSFA